MPHYKYRLIDADGASRESRLTAKTQEAAERKILEVNSGARIDSIQEIPGTARKPRTSAPKPATATKSPPVSEAAAVAGKRAPAPKPLSAKKQSKLEKLLYRQDEACFFCGKRLTKAEASIEHLQPKSDGGNDADGNVVACCVALNRTMGNMPLKEKVHMILNKAGRFTCPRE